jgi:N-terminal domain of anti-restriction factor ArdC/IrrE N-terminal-like domain
MASQTLTDEQRAERRARERELVRDSVERLRSSDGWQRWLRTRSRFRSYSFGNQLLIAHQHPTATRVAGFRAWLALGYCVQKGERSIRIWAPCPPSRRQLERWEHDGADPASKPRIGWRLAAVFAQDQVAPLPPPAVPAPLDPPGRDVDGEDLAELILPLRNLAAEIGSSVTFEPVPGSAHGYYELQTKRIVVDVSLSHNQQIKTLIHELAHALLRAEPQEDDEPLDRAAEELVVESIAMSVCGFAGVDTSGYSIPYLASWAGQADLDVLERAAKLTDRLATRIETALDPEPDRPEEPDAGAGADAP